MAGIEKVCECPQNDCVYHAGDMYKFKRNSLQINPECRHQFKGLTATCAIVIGENLSDDDQQFNLECGYGKQMSFRGTKVSVGTMNLTLDEIVKINGKLYHENFWFTSYHRGNPKYYYDALRHDHRIDVWVYVQEHNTYYLNWLYSKKDIRAFKRNMRKLFGYDIPIMKDLSYNQEIGSEKLAKSMIDLLRLK